MACKLRRQNVSVTDPAHTPEPPYYAVIFSARRDVQPGDRNYEETAARMLALVADQPGFLGVDTAYEGDFDITVSYWTDEAAIAGWKRNDEHSFAQYEGKTRWYDAYEIRVARVERAYGSRRPPT
jgi:heme-degrading monooxygenase HmoA